MISCSLMPGKKCKCHFGGGFQYKKLYCMFQWRRKPQEGFKFHKLRLRKAMGGINTDEKMIIEIFCNHTFDQVFQCFYSLKIVLAVQRERIQRAYNNLGSKDLLSDLKVSNPMDKNHIKIIGRLDIKKVWLLIIGHAWWSFLWRDAWPNDRTSQV